VQFQTAETMIHQAETIMEEEIVTSTSEDQDLAPLRIITMTRVWE